MRKHLLVLLAAVVASMALASSASAAPFVFSNNTDLAPPDDATLATPSPIEVTTPGLITRVEVQLDNINHTRPADLDVIVETPSGQFIYLMSDNCGSDDMVNDFFQFADDHATSMGANSASCIPTQVKPSDNFADTDAWTTAPGAAPVTNFAGLVGTNQTGEWRLHVADDEAGETGTITGWGIEIDTTTPNALRIPELFDEGTTGPIVKPISGFPRTITDVDVQLNDFTHTHLDDLDFALESPAGTKVLFASDGCGSTDRRNLSWIFDDESPTPYSESDTPACATNLQRFAPVNHDPDETAFGSVLTGGPFGSSLSAFDGQFANGNWKLYINDDADGDYGFIAGYDLAITMRGTKVQTPTNPTIKSKKFGKKSIKATGRVTLTGEALTAGECAGPVKSTFQSITVKKKGKKKVTTYKKIVAVNSSLTSVAGVCGFDISAKLPKKYSGKKVRLITNYLGGEYIAPFTRTTTEKIKKIKFS